MFSTCFPLALKQFIKLKLKQTESFAAITRLNLLHILGQNETYRSHTGNI